ncbi:MAG: hypothetical protein R3B56_00805 [Candidatus Scalinduaceae bacterium]
MRRSSRSVFANLRESWAKRRYPAHFVSKLTGDIRGRADHLYTDIKMARLCRT